MTFLALAAVLLGACQGQVLTPTETQLLEPPHTQVPTEPPSPIVVTCDPSNTSAPAAERYRAWVLFREPEPTGFAKDVSSLLRSGGNEQVIIRADLVDPIVVAEPFDVVESIVPAEQLPITVVVPVDAASEADFNAALSLLVELASDKAPSVLHAILHIPSPPHCSSTYVTEGEHELFPLEEYDPPGRHPNSPGANPWG